MSGLSDITGYVASALVLMTFATTDMRKLRVLAVLSNLAFIGYGALESLPPVLFLHLLLLPLNLFRLNELARATRVGSEGEEQAQADTRVNSVSSNG